MSGDALLLASLLTRALQAALDAALRADPASAARLYAAAATGERTLRIETTTPLAPDVRTLTLAVSRDGLGVRIEDPLPADATLTGPTAALLALLRTPARLDEGDEVGCTGDRAFALHVLLALRNLRPDPLLPLGELLGAGLPSALHTARAAIGSIAGGALSALGDLMARRGLASSPAPDAGNAGPANARSTDRSTEREPRGDGAG
jgi:ubiquinone biosynthesis protein UbiJ